MKEFIENLTAATWIFCAIGYCVAMFRGDNARAMIVLTVVMIPATMVFLCTFWGAHKG